MPFTMWAWVWARRRRLAARRAIVKLAGGTQVLPFGGLPGTDTGARNVRSVPSCLAQHGIVPKASDTGRTHGRTVELSLSDGTRRTVSKGKPKRSK